MLDVEKELSKYYESKESNIDIPDDKKISDMIKFHYPHLAKELAVCRQVIFTMNDFNSLISPLEEVVVRESLYKRVYKSESEVRNAVESLIKKRVLFGYQIISHWSQERIPKSQHVLTFVNRNLLIELISQSNPN